MNESGALLTNNERSIMNAIRSQGSLPRSHVVEHVALSQQSVHRIIDMLLSERYLFFNKAVVKGRGKPSPQVSINCDHKTFIGISVGTTSVEYKVVDLTGEVIFSSSIEGDPNHREAVVTDIRETTNGLQRDGILVDREIVGVGIAMQGFRTRSLNQFTTPVLLDNWSRIPIDDLFNDSLNLPVFVENNATCGAMAELYVGSGRAHSCFGYISFNLGLGGGMAFNNEPILGGHGNAGELSNIFQADQAVHRPALGELLARLNQNGVEVPSLEFLVKHFDPNWAGVSDWINEVSPYLDLVIRAYNAILDPTAIIFGGEAPRQLRELLLNACESPTTDRYGDTVPYPDLILSEIKGDASTLGAALLPLRNLIY